MSVPLTQMTVISSALTPMDRTPVVVSMATAWMMMEKLVVVRFIAGVFFSTKIEY